MDHSLDAAMRDLSKRILPLCTYYSIIIRFVEGLKQKLKKKVHCLVFLEKTNFKWGLVNDALCAAIRESHKKISIYLSTGKFAEAK